MWMWGDMSLWNIQGPLLHSGDDIVPRILTVDCTFKAHLNIMHVMRTPHNLVPSVTHCILGKPDQFRVTCPSIRKSNISQSANDAKNTQDLSTKRRHLTSVHPSNLFFHFNRFLLSKQRRNRRLFLTSAEICALVPVISM